VARHRPADLRASVNVEFVAFRILHRYGIVVDALLIPRLVSSRPEPDQARRLGLHPLLTDFNRYITNPASMASASINVEVYSVLAGLGHRDDVEPDSRSGPGWVRDPIGFTRHLFLRDAETSVVVIPGCKSTRWLLEFVPKGPGPELGFKTRIVNIDRQLKSHGHAFFSAKARKDAVP
jgi:hypothetical protein